MCSKSKKLLFTLLVVISLIISCPSSATRTTKAGPISGPYHERTVELCIYISTNNTSTFYRGDSINISYRLRGETDGLKSRGVSDINGLIFVPKYIELTDNPNLNRFRYDSDNQIITFKSDINTNKSEDCCYEGIISLNAQLGPHNLADTIGDNWGWHRRGDNKLNITDGEVIITIINNMPQICSRCVIISEKAVSSCIPCSDTRTLIYKSIGDPIEMSLEVNASDRENETLFYNWAITETNDTNYYEHTNEADRIDTYLNNQTYFLGATNLTPGKKYSFYVSVNDSIESSEFLPASILYGNETYDNIYLPLNHPTVPILFYIAIIIILCIIGINRDYLYNISRRKEMRQKESKKNSYLDEAVLVTIILLITLTYILTNLYSYKYAYQSDELIVYLKSLSLFEIYVYLVVFVAVVYFTEACFGQEFKPNSKKARTGLLSGLANSINLVTVSKLWIINSIFMLVLLLSLDAIILEVNQLNVQDWLMNYYGEMGEIFATILAIIAAFYTAIPKNIISPRGRGASQQDKPYRYLHTKILHYFLVLYGVIVALSIWGFSVGLTVEFPALVELSRANLFNLVSIAVFETTLLLVPPAISCLYELLRSMLFTGNVKIMSRPCGAKIYVDGTYTRLLTPNVLMLPKGFHKILLKKEGYNDYEVEGEREELKEEKMICINAGTEQEYECRLKPKRRKRRNTL